MYMDIIFRGEYSDNEVIESFVGVLGLFKGNYHVSHFREMHLTVTLMDDQGHDVELVDSQTSQAYRFFEVYREHSELGKQKSKPFLRLVVDNTR